MPRVTKYKENRLRKEILSGKSGKQALLDAGFTNSTANQGSRIKVLQNTYKRIEDEFKLSDITPEYVISKLKYEVDTAQKSSDRTAALSLLGKYLALFTDRTLNKTDLSIEDKNILNKYGLNRINEIL